MAERLVSSDAGPALPPRRTLGVVFVIDDGPGFRVLVREGVANDFLLAWGSVVSYRRVDERLRYRWLEQLRSGDDCALFEVDGSLWIQSLREDALYSGYLRWDEMTHFALVTLDDVVEVVAFSAPTVSRVDWRDPASERLRTAWVSP